MSIAMGSLLWKQVAALALPLALSFPLSIYINVYTYTPPATAEAATTTAMQALFWHKVAAVSGVAAVGLGTYGANMFKPKNHAYKDVWQTGTLYHLVHTAAMLAAPITKYPNIFGGLLTTGILAFSGTCYMVAYHEDRKYAPFAPFGGYAFICAWASLLF